MYTLIHEQAVYKIGYKNGKKFYWFYSLHFNSEVNNKNIIHQVVRPSLYNE